MHNEGESTHECENIIALNVLNQCSSNIEISKHKNNIKYDNNNIKSSTFIKQSKINDGNDIQMEKTYEKIEIDYEKYSDKRPCIKIEIFGENYEALLDTGASISIFGSGTEHLWQQAASIEDCSRVNIKMPNGIIVKSQPMKIIPVKYLKIERDIKVAFAPTVVCPVIMGIDFFHKFDLKILRTLRNVDSFDIVECHAINPNSEVEIELSETLKRKLHKIINQFPFDDDKSLGCQDVIKHKIDTGDHAPIVQHQYNYNIKVQEKINVVIDKWLSQGVIEKSTSSWRNPIVVVKKQDGNIRVCLDARKLNSITKRDRLLTPNVFEALSSVPADVKIFGRVDKNQAFLQTMLMDEDREKTAFFVKGRGLFQFVRMPFGLANAPATQTRLMLEIFGELEPYVLVYFDDIIIMGKNFQHFLELLESVANKLREYNLTISREKMSLPLKSIKILGHIVSKEGIKTDSSKTDAISKWPTPKTKRELQRFLGMCNWYRRHIKDFSTIAAPMTEQLKGKKFQWTRAANESFENLKKVMISPPVLRPPRWDIPMNLMCDASNEGIGAALTQIDEKEGEFVIEYYSAKLTENERKFSPTEKECLAVIKSIKHFRPYIELMQLNIITDHYSLKYLLNMTVTSGRLARWILFLQPYVNCIQHRSGKLMKVPDALSRAPIMNAEDEEVHEMSLLSNEEINDDYKRLSEKIMRHPEKIPNFRMDRGKILYKANSNRPNGKEWKIVPKTEYRDQIIQSSHEDCVHGGIRCTIAKIREKWHWKNMSRDVKRWVNNCYKCLCVKASNKKLGGPMINSRIPRTCMDTMSIDIKGPFPPSGIRRYRYIIVMIDILSRYAWIDLCKDVTATKIIKFMEQVFQELEYPRIMIHDNGKQFTSTLFTNYLKENNIISNATPIYCAKNNPVERFNRTLGDSIRMYLLDLEIKHSDWHKFVHEIIEKLNNRINETTEYSPKVVLFGNNPKREGEKLIRRLDHDHFQIMKTAYDKSIKKFRMNQKNYNEGKINRSFAPDSVVMVATHKISSAFRKFNRKLAPKYEPALVKKKIFANAYQVKLQSGRTVTVDVGDVKEVPIELQNVIKRQIFNSNSSN